MKDVNATTAYEPVKTFARKNNKITYDQIMDIAYNLPLTHPEHILVINTFNEVKRAGLEMDHNELNSIETVINGMTNEYCDLLELNSSDIK